MTKKYSEMDSKDRGWLFGNIYGYPDCCIKEHVDCEGPHGFLVKESRGEDNPFMGSGFVPCEKCWNRSEEDMLFEINTKRHKELPPFIKDGDVFDQLMIIVEKYYK